VDPTQPNPWVNPTHGQLRTGLFCRVGCGGQAGAICVRSVSECVGRRSATAGRTPTQNALVGPTQFTPPGTTQTGPSCLVWRAVWIGHNWVDLFRSVQFMCYERAFRPRPPLFANTSSQSCPWVHFVWPDPTQPISWPNPTQPITTNNGANSLVVTYFYTQI